MERRSGSGEGGWLIDGCLLGEVVGDHGNTVGIGMIVVGTVKLPEFMEQSIGWRLTLLGW